MPRLLNPLLNPNGYLSAAGAVLAAAVMITNAVHRHGIIDPTVIVAAVGAVGALFARQQVTPVKDPKDASGSPLAPQPAPPVMIVNAPTSSKAETEKFISDAISSLAQKGMLRSPLSQQAGMHVDLRQVPTTLAEPATDAGQPTEPKA